MASSPQFPPPRRGPHVVPRLPVERGRQFPWPLIGLICAAVLAAGLVFLLPRLHVARMSPTGAVIPQQPVPGEIELSGFKMTAAPTGGAYYLDGLLFNHGKTDVTGVWVQLNFVGTNGKAVGSELRSVAEMNQQLNGAQNLIQNPIKPTETRPVRIYFDHPPANWNHQIPGLVVAEVTATTTRK